MTAATTHTPSSNSTSDALAALARFADLAGSSSLPPNLTPEQQLQFLYAGIVAYIERKLLGLFIMLLVAYSVLCTLCIALIVYLRRNRGVARRGDTDAARKLLLPAFEPLLWLLGATSGAYTLCLVAMLVFEFHPTELTSVFIECFYAGRQFVLLLVVVFMLQKSVTLPALARAVVGTLALSTYTLPVAWYMQTHRAMDDPSRTDVYFWLQVGAHSLGQLLFVYVLIWPPSRASTQALRCYCVFALVLHAVEIAYFTAFWRLEIDWGFRLAFASLALGSLCPLFVWGVLRADTEHWRGMGQRAVALQALVREQQRHTNVHEHVSSDGLHVLIEMHRRHVIDFAHLELRQRIGVGSSAVVYNGVLHSKTPVAVKVYTPSTVTEETVAAFSHEAALCGALHHPNVVTFYGMCVSPPTICLVSELCQGSLDVVTYTLARRRRDAMRDAMRDATRQCLQAPNASDQQLLLVNIGYMLDAARAVAYIHSFSPAFVHRDIKPANFLVDAVGTVKLTDFGESRFLPKLSDIVSTATTSATSTVVLSVSPGERSRLRGETTGTRQTQQLLSLSPPSSPSPPYVDFETTDRRSDRARTGSTGAAAGGRSSGRTTTTTTTATRAATAAARPRAATTAQMTVKGTVDYMAPEMIQGRAGRATYDEAADVYSLAVTMWDVLHPAKDKYPRAKNNHLRVFESVVAGSRPALDATLLPALRSLLESGWHQDHWRRPTARNIVLALECIQEDVAATFASELQSAMQQRESSGAAHAASGVTTGEEGRTQWVDSNNGAAGANASANRDAGQRRSIVSVVASECQRSDSNTLAAASDHGRSTSKLLAAAVQSGGSADAVNVVTASGDALVQQLMRLDAVAALSEAVRLGSLLMDAGYLHHVKHACTFECRTDMLYVFDADRTRRGQPSIAILERGSSSSESDEHIGRVSVAAATLRRVNSGGKDDSLSSWLARASQQTHPAPLRPQYHDQRLPLTSSLHGARAAATRHHSNSLTSDRSDARTSADSAIGAFTGRHARSDSSNDDVDMNGMHSSSNGSEHHDACACRRLGQRLVRPERSVKRLFRRKLAPAIPEHSVLTANLLAGSDYHYFDNRSSCSDDDRDDSGRESHDVDDCADGRGRGGASGNGTVDSAAIRIGVDTAASNSSSITVDDDNDDDCSREGDDTFAFEAFV